MEEKNIQFFFLIILYIKKIETKANVCFPVTMSEFPLIELDCKSHLPSLDDLSWNANPWWALRKQCE